MAWRRHAICVANHICVEKAALLILCLAGHYAATRASSAGSMGLSDRLQVFAGLAREGPWNIRGCRVGDARQPIKALITAGGFGDGTGSRQLPVNSSGSKGVSGTFKNGREPTSAAASKSRIR